MKPLILACHYGGWSHINKSFFAALKSEFADYDWLQLDYERDVLGRSAAWRWLFLAVAPFAYGRRLSKLLAKPGLLRYEWSDVALLTALAFRKGRSLAAARLKAMSTGRSPAFVLQTGSRYAARVTGVPHFIYTDHTHLYNLKYPSFKRADLNNQHWINEEKKLYNEATAVFTLSENIRQSLLLDYGLPPANCVTVGAGFNADAAKLRTNPTRDWSRKEVLFVGTQWVRKGGPLLADAFHQLLKTHPDAKLTIVGCSPKLRLPNVNEVGFVPLDEVAAHFSRSSVFCMPSRREPFGIVYLEAMAFGLPIVAASIGALPEIVEHQRTGLLVPDGDVQALASALSTLLGAPDTLDAYGTRGRERALAQFQWSKAAARAKAEILARLTNPKAS